MRDGDKLVAAFPAPSFRVRFVADFPQPIGTQYFYGEIDRRAVRGRDRRRAHVRFLHEVEALLARGLGAGRKLENALVFTADGPMQPLRWPNEAVRHKVLDLIGDFALLGAWPHAKSSRSRAGTNSTLADDAPYARDCACLLHRRAALAELDIRQIFEILPHRYPMLLVDRILEFEPMVRVARLQEHHL